MSSQVAVGPNSFVDNRQPYNPKSPPPKYFTEDMLLTPLPICKEEILKGMIEPANGGLVCID